MEAWIDILKTFGPSVAFMAFTVWRDYMRENRMGHRLDVKEDQLLELSNKSVTAIEQNTASNNRLTEAIERLPCADRNEFPLPRRGGSGGFKQHGAHGE